MGKELHKGKLLEVKEETPFWFRPIVPQE